MNKGERRNTDVDAFLLLIANVVVWPVWAGEVNLDLTLVAEGSIGRHVPQRVKLGDDLGPLGGSRAQPGVETVLGVGGWIRSGVEIIGPPQIPAFLHLVAQLEVAKLVAAAGAGPGLDQ